MHNKTLNTALAELQSDPAIQEIHVRGSACLQVIRSIPPDEVLRPLFSRREDAIDWVQEFAWSHRARLDVTKPEAGGVTETGWRWHAAIPPLSSEQPLLMLRRQQFDQLRLDAFQDPHGYIRPIVNHIKLQKPLLIAGPTGAGKTSLLVMLLRLTAITQRVMFIESIREIPPLSPCWMFMLAVGRDNSLHCLNAALRLSPGRFVIGEVREGDAELFVKTCLTGHGGSLGTIHASSAQQVKLRLGPYLSELENPDALGVVILERQTLPTIQAFKTNLFDQTRCG